MNQQERAGAGAVSGPCAGQRLRAFGNTKKSTLAEMQEEEVWPSSSPDSNSFRFFVWGESELWVIAKCRNKTEDRYDPEDKGGDGILQQGHRGEGLQELDVHDLGCR